MRRIDDGEEVVYFTDEAGSWQVGVVWTSVLPVLQVSCSNGD